MPIAVEGQITVSKWNHHIVQWLFNITYLPPFNLPKYVISFTTLHFKYYYNE